MYILKKMSLAFVFFLVACNENDYEVAQQSPVPTVTKIAIQSIAPSPAVSGTRIKIKMSLMGITTPLLGIVKVYDEKNRLVCSIEGKIGDTTECDTFVMIQTDEMTKSYYAVYKMNGASFSIVSQKVALKVIGKFITDAKETVIGVERSSPVVLEEGAASLYCNGKDDPNTPFPDGNLVKHPLGEVEKFDHTWRFIQKEDGERIVNLVWQDGTISEGKYDIYTGKIIIDEPMKITTKDVFTLKGSYRLNAVFDADNLVIKGVSEDIAINSWTLSSDVVKCVTTREYEAVLKKE